MDSGLAKSLLDLVSLVLASNRKKRIEFSPPLSYVPNRTSSSSSSSSTTTTSNKSTGDGGGGDDDGGGGGGESKEEKKSMLGKPEDQKGSLEGVVTSLAGGLAALTAAAPNGPLALVATAGEGSGKVERPHMLLLEFLDLVCGDPQSTDHALDEGCTGNVQLYEYGLAGV